MKELFVSIVIPTYNRERVLCETIADVLAQEYSLFELLVVDQSAVHEPETEVFLKLHEDRMRYFRLPTPNLPAARNAGIAKSRGEIVIFLDDDVSIPTRTFIQAHVSAYRAPHVGGVAGRLTVPHWPVIETLDPRYRHTYVGWRYTNFAYSQVIEAESAYGANMSFRRRILLELGGFDENYSGQAWNEDVDMCLRVRARGHTVLFIPDAHVVHKSSGAGGCENRYIHSHTPEAQQFYRSYFRNTFYFIFKNMPLRHWPALIWWKYRSHAFNWPYFRTSFRYFLVRHWIMVRAAWEAAELALGEAKNSSVRAMSE